MDFDLSAEQTILREGVARYCRENYGFQSRQTLLRSSRGFSDRHWTSFAQFGWLGATLPSDVGGYDGSIVEAAIILEEFGHALVLEPYLSCAILAAQAVNVAAGPQQRKALLEPMIQGRSILALAHAEPGEHHSACAVRTTARRTDNGDFLINGSKRMILNGNQADRLIVSARITGDTSETGAVRLFVLDSSAERLVRRCYRTLDGSGAADLWCDDVRVPANALLEAGDNTFEAVERAIDFATVTLCAEAVGAMNTVISTTTDYLKTRRAYGTTLSTFQVLQHRLADMLVDLEMSRSILYRGMAAFIRGDRQEQRHAAAAVKAMIGEAGQRIAADGIQLHGAMGMVDDYIIGQLFKRLTVVGGLFGDSEFHYRRCYVSTLRE